MAKKGSNTIVLECKENIINVVNDCVAQGLPISMVEILFENILNTINNSMKDVLEQENHKYLGELELEKQQDIVE